MSVHNIFGAFSSNFLGISISFEDLLHHEFFKAVYRGGGVIPELPEGMTDLEATLVGTTLEHEARHWHDFLLSPLTIATFRMRSSGVLNAYTLWQYLTNSTDFDIIPTPVSDWVSKGTADRKKQIEFAQNWPEFQKGDVWNPPHIDFEKPSTDSSTKFFDRAPTEQDIKAPLRILVRNQEHVRAGRVGAAVPNGTISFSPRTVFELSALNVQLLSAWSTFGENGYITFVRHVVSLQSYTVQRAFLLSLAVAGCLTSADGKKLRDNLDAKQAELDTRPGIANYRLGVMLTWSMMGDRSIEGEIGCPADRLMRLLVAMLSGEDSVFVDSLNAQTLFDLWDEHFKLTPYSKISKGVDERLANAIDKVANLAGLHEVPATIHASLVGLYDARQDFSRQFFAEPSHYASPAKYIHDLNKWPDWIIHFDLRKTGWGIRPEDANSDGEEIAFETVFNAHDGSEMAQEMTMNGFFKKSNFNLKESLELKHLFTLHDILMEPDNLDVYDQQALRKVLLETHGKKVLRVT